MIDCCSLPLAPEFCFRVPNNYLELLSMLPDCRSYANARADYVDFSSNLLHAAPIKHDPYTPDSMDSPSPNALIATGEVPDLDADHTFAGDNASAQRSTQTSIGTSRRIDRAVSPALLKSRLELIVQNKRQEDADFDVDTSDIKRSPSECHLRSLPDGEDRQWCVRKNRCNSDVSWQRSHVLTEAWVRGKGQQGYHSFSNFANRSSSNSSPPNMVDGLPPDLIIPRIAIINASNFESNESSVYFHDDRLSNYSENKLSAYSDGRTKTLSGEGASSEKSDEICDKTDEGSNILNSSAEQVTGNMKENMYPIGHDQSNDERYFGENNGKFIEDQCDMCKKTKCQIEARALITNASSVKNDTVTDKTKNDKSTVERHDVSDDSGLRDSRSTEIPSESQPSSRALRRIDANRAHVDVDQAKLIDVAPCEKSSAETGQLLQSRDRDGNVIKICSDVHADYAVSHDAEIVSCESKQKMCASNNTTRSNSAHSQDISDHAGSVRLKLKAYKVTERYKSNIIGRQTRCRKCCCVVS